jgi:hypothetical protein
MSEVVELKQPQKNDQDLAAEYKERASKLLGQLADVMREAERKDFRIDFQFQRDQIGMPFFIGPTISKRY